MFGRKKKVEIPKFNPDLPCSGTQRGDQKVLSQGEAFFSYAEPSGPWVEGRGRELKPTPVFIGWIRDWNLQDKLKEYESMKEGVFTDAHKFTEFEKGLKSEGIIE